MVIWIQQLNAGGGSTLKKPHNEDSSHFSEKGQGRILQEFINKAPS